MRYSVDLSREPFDRVVLTNCTRMSDSSSSPQPDRECRSELYLEAVQSVAWSPDASCIHDDYTVPYDSASVNR